MGLPHEGVGVKKLGIIMSFETQGKQTFLAGYPGILTVICRGGRKSLRKERFELNVWSL